MVRVLIGTHCIVRQLRPKNRAYSSFFQESTKFDTDVVLTYTVVFLRGFQKFRTPGGRHIEFQNGRPL